MGPPALPGGPLADRLTEILDTVVALQRAEHLVDGAYAGPQSAAEAYRDLLHCTSTLGIALPPTIVSACGAASQGAFGTDERPNILLSSLFLAGATPTERRFAIGRACGQVHAGHVTWGTLYALLVDHDGLRRVARRHVGPTLEIVLAPLSLGARLGLSRWHRAAEVSADRAGLLCCGDLQGAGLALLRMTLGTTLDLDPAEFLAQRRTVGTHEAPGRWTEVLSARPWLHKRLAALDLFARSECYARLSGQTDREALLSDQDLAQRTAELLAIGASP